MKSKRAIIAIVVVLVVAAFTGLIVWFVSQQDESRLIKSGEVLVSTHCAKCHASGRSEISPIPAAPAFRTLFRRYPAESLVESLGEGLTSRHPDMPTFGPMLAEKLAAVSGVRAVEPVGPGRFRLLAEGDVRPQAAAAVVNAGGTLQGLSFEEPSLGQIYSQYFQNQEGHKESPHPPGLGRN